MTYKLERDGDATRSSRLSAKTIVYEGVSGNFLRGSQGVLEAEGAKIVRGGTAAGPCGSRERASALIYHFSLEHDLGESLESAIAQARNSAVSLYEHGLETIICVASLSNAQTPISQVKYEAAKAGLKYIVQSLVEEWRGRGVRVNGLMMHPWTDALYLESEQDSLATLLFLVSDEARRLNGETLILEDPPRTNAH